MACVRAKDVICFKGKTLTKEGQKATESSGMTHDSQSQAFLGLVLRCSQDPQQYNANKVEKDEH